MRGGLKGGGLQPSGAGARAGALQHSKRVGRANQAAPGWHTRRARRRPAHQIWQLVELSLPAAVPGAHSVQAAAPGPE